ncbi:MAG: DUF547 domain-containing protein [Bacteroidota bacterium]
MKKRVLFLIIAIVLGGTSLGYLTFSGMNINEIGLKVLSWVKKIKGESVDLTNIDAVLAPPIQHGQWTELLQQHVSPEGTVDYQGFIQDQQRLDAYLDLLTNNPPGTNWSEEEQLAYWINAYNAFTVKLILNHYPLASIKDIARGLPMINSPWDIKFFKIGDTDFDLNTIEHEILRKQFLEPRIHFAINCASFSCPKLRNEAFEASILDKQLNDQTEWFIHNPDKNRINDSEVQLSSIFSWFESDFTKEGSLITFLQQYKADIREDLNIQYIDYDWSLNE